MLNKYYTSATLPLSNHSCHHTSSHLNKLSSQYSTCINKLLTTLRFISFLFFFCSLFFSSFPRISFLWKKGDIPNGQNTQKRISLFWCEKNFFLIGLFFFSCYWAYIGQSLLLHSIINIVLFLLLFYCFYNMLIVQSSYVLQIII